MFRAVRREALLAAMVPVAPFLVLPRPVTSWPSAWRCGLHESSHRHDVNAKNKIDVDVVDVVTTVGG